MPCTQHLTPDKVYHATVMPCYDKKLEASRPDFFSQEHQTRDVDCVITTGAGPQASRRCDREPCIFNGLCCS